jgi:hypothetical protein
VTNLAFSITKDNRLRDCQCVVQIAQRVKLPFFSFDSDKELFDSFECQLITKSHKIIVIKTNSNKDF